MAIYSTEPHEEIKELKREVARLKAQLTEAQRWTPIADNDVTRGFAAMLVFNGLRDYADCRVCRLADAAQEGGER